MSFYREHVLPRLVHWTLRGKPFQELRARALQGAAGAVLEIGFGSGLNLPYYGAAVTSLRIVEPSALALRLAEKAIARAPFPVQPAGLEGERIAADPDSADCAVSTWTLCTVPDPARALAEVARVLKPGGRLLFVEHGLAPDPAVARWQRRLNGLQMRIGGGCHLTRDMEALIAASPLRLEALERFYIKGPKTHTYMYLGRARKA